MGSGAGLNRVGQLGGKRLLSFGTAAVAVAAPLAGYGTIGITDSGPIMWEAIGFKTWAFQQLGGTTGYSVTIYGTIDPSLYTYLDSVTGAIATPQQLATIVPASSWVPLPGPAEQTGTGTIANPMVSGTTNFFQYNGTLVAVRAVLTATVTPTGTGTVVGFATP